MIIRLVKRVKLFDSEEEFQIQSKPFSWWPFWSDKLRLEGAYHQTVFTDFESAQRAMQRAQRNLDRSRKVVWKTTELWRTK